jgi:hypothetical protein
MVSTAGVLAVLSTPSSGRSRRPNDCIVVTADERNFEGVTVVNHARPIM